jgi:hypothetical protein
MITALPGGRAPNLSALLKGDPASMVVPSLLITNRGHGARADCGKALVVRPEDAPFEKRSRTEI